MVVKNAVVDRKDIAKITKLVLVLLDVAMTTEDNTKRNLISH